MISRDHRYGFLWASITPPRRECPGSIVVTAISYILLEMSPLHAAWFAATVLPLATAQIASLPFQDCSSSSSPSSSSSKISISTVYAQITNTQAREHFLNLTLIGTTNSEILFSSNTSKPLLCVFVFLFVYIYIVLC